MKRQSTATVDRLVERLNAEGLFDLQFEDRYEPNQRGEMKNVGAAEARAKLTGLSNRGIKVSTKVFRLPGDDTGGVMVAARAEDAEQVFAEYGAGFYEEAVR